MLVSSLFWKTPIPHISTQDKSSNLVPAEYTQMICVIWMVLKTRMLILDNALCIDWRHPEANGFPFASGWSQGFFLLLSQGLFPCRCCLWLGSWLIFSKAALQQCLFNAVDKWSWIELNWMGNPGNPINQTNLLNPTLNTRNFPCVNIDKTVGSFAKSEYSPLLYVVRINVATC